MRGPSPADSPDLPSPQLTFSVHQTTVLIRLGLALGFAVGGLAVPPVAPAAGIICGWWLKMKCLGPCLWAGGCWGAGLYRGNGEVGWCRGWRPCGAN